MKNISEQCLLAVKPKKSRQHDYLGEEKSDAFITKTIICFSRSSLISNSSKVSKPLTPTDCWRKRHYKIFLRFQTFFPISQRILDRKVFVFLRLVTTSYGHGVATCSDIWPHTLLYVLHAGSKQLLLE